MRDKLQRVDNEFIKELEEISQERIKTGIDKRQRSFRRLTQAIPRASKWNELKEILKEAEIK